MGSVKLRSLYISPQHKALNEVTKLPQSVRGMRPGGNAEDLVEFFEAEAFSFRNEEQHRKEADKIPHSIVCKGALRLECLEQARPRNRKKKVEEPGYGLLVLHCIL